MQSIYRTQNGDDLGTVFSDFVRNLPSQGKRDSKTSILMRPKSSEQFKKLRFQKTVITPKYIADDLAETPLDRNMAKQEHP